MLVFCFLFPFLPFFPSSFSSLSSPLYPLLSIVSPLLQYSLRVFPYHNQMSHSYISVMHRYDPCAVERELFGHKVLPPPVDTYALPVLR